MPPFGIWACGVSAQMRLMPGVPAIKQVGRSSVWRCNMAMCTRINVLPHGTDETKVVCSDTAMIRSAPTIVDVTCGNRMGENRDERCSDEADGGG